MASPSKTTVGRPNSRGSSKPRSRISRAQSSRCSSSKIRRRKNDSLSTYQLNGKTDCQRFGCASVVVTRDVTVHERLTEAIQKAGLAGDNAWSWSVEQVALFVNAAGFPLQSSLFGQHLINGEAFMRMQERHLIDHLKMKLGPTLRLFALLRGLQRKYT